LGEALELIRATARSSSRPERRPLDGVVRIRCEGRRGIHTGFLRDLSAAGMFVRILDPELPGSRVDFDLDLQLPSGRRRISGAGEVTWCRSGYEGPARPPGMGIRFLHLERVAQDGLDEALGTQATLPPFHDPLVPPPHALTGRETAAAARGASSGPRSGRWRWAALLALLTLAAIGHTGWRSRLEPPPVAERGAATRAAPGVEPRSAVGSDAPTGVLAEWLESLEPRPPVASPEAPREPEGDGRPSLATEAAAGAALATTNNGAPAGWPPMGRVTGIRWVVTAAGTVLTIEGDGALAAERLRSSGIRGEAPRRVLRLSGVRGEARHYEADTAELRRVRTGFHPEGDGELHVVLDLASPEVTASPPELLESGVRLLLALPASSALGTAGRASLGGDPLP
jgi:hypothetical protein